MALIRIQHSFQGPSGVAKDQYVNTFHVLAGGLEGGDLADVATALKDFYHSGTGLVGTAPISYYMANSSDTAGARIKMYDLGDAIPRATIYDEIYTPPAHGVGAGVAMPAEVAVCLSYAANPVSGTPIASTRGRIYIGPLNTTATESVTATQNSRPAQVLQEGLCQAGKRLFEAWADIDPVMLWVVHSPTRNSSHGIVRFWCDDAWDIQRRRGDAPTSREEITI